MRDSPLTLNVLWGKSRKELKDVWRERKDNSAHYPQKKEKPRGNGALKENKQ